MINANIQIILFNVMLKTLEYVDPHLSQKIVNLQKQLFKVEQSKLQIINNSTLSPTTKTKLLRYQLECQSNIRKLLQDQKHKLGEYLDQQTNVITKQNRENQYIQCHKNSFTLNQSTRIDISLDDSKSLQITRNSQHFRKSINAISQAKETNTSNHSKGIISNRYKAKLKRLNKKVGKQQKLINMLVVWLKIYFQRQQNSSQLSVSTIQKQNRQTLESNRILQARCKELQNQLAQIKSDFKNSSLVILESHRKCEKLRLQNKQFELERKNLIQNVRSLQKRK